MESAPENGGIILKKVPEGTQVTLEVSFNTPLQTLSSLIESETGINDGPHRFVFRGQVFPNWNKLSDLKVNPGDTIYYLKHDVSRQNSTSAASSNRLTLADPMRDLLGSPLLQALLDNPNLMMIIMESNPHIIAMRERSPELNALFDDPQAMRDLFRTMRNPAMAREMVRTTDRALSNVDAMPGGFDALRQLYHDIQEPVWDSILASNRESRPTETESVNYTPLENELDQPFPRAWNSAQDQTGRRPESWRPSLQSSGGTDLPATMHLSSISQGSDPARSSNENHNNLLQFLVPPLIGNRDESRLDGAPASMSNWTDMWSRLVGGGVGAPEALPRERYRTQLEALRGMGFENETQCLEALERHNGVLNQALDYLLRPQ